MNIETLEQARKQALKYFFIGLALAAIVFLLGIVFIVVETIDSTIGFIFIVIGLLIGFGAYYFADNKIKRIKATIVNNLLKKNGIADNYHESGVLGSLDEIVRLGFLKAPDKVAGREFYNGKYNNVSFETSNAILQERVVVRRNGKNEVHYETYFSGKIIVFDLIHFDNSLYMIENGSSVNVPRKLNKLDTELITFNERYKVYTNDEIKAFKYLTPRMLQSLIEIEKSIKATFCYAFQNSKLYLFLENTNINLSVKLFKTLTEDEIRRIEATLLLPRTLINELYLGGYNEKKTD